MNLVCARSMMIKQAVSFLVALALLVSPVAAASMPFDKTYTSSFSTVATVTYTGGGIRSSEPVSGMIIGPGLGVPEFKTMFAQIPSSKVNNYGSLPTSAEASVDIHYSNHRGDKGSLWSTGTYGYFKYTAGGAQYLQLWIEIDSPQSVSSARYLKFFLQSGETLTYPRVLMPRGAADTDGSAGLYNALTTDTSGIKGSFAGNYEISGHRYVQIMGEGIKCYPVLSGEWRNQVTVSSPLGSGPTERVVVTIDKSHSGYNTLSDHVVAFDETAYTVLGSMSDAEYIVMAENWPFTVSIRDVHTDTWHNETFGIDQNKAPVTIHVRSSQTGALLADAHLTILDSHAGSTPAVDQTLPTGTGTFDLEKAYSLRYHASATADNYTLLSPILFGVPEGGTTIILWMAPDAPPDVPTEPEKSMLYGYILTQGSQQPISGATVSLNGHGSTTTSSTGFYLFNNIDPGQYTITVSAPLHDALSEPVTVDPAATQHNLALKGHFLLTVTAKDDTSLANLHNATISLSDGQESTQNPATFNVDYGPYTITAAAGGYYPQTQSAYLDKPGTTTTTVLMTAKPEPIPPPEMPNYPPHNVKFTVQTIFGTPIPGVNVTAQGIQQTPSTNILERLLGINTTSTPINTELMSGTTDSNGEINFMMVEAVKYQITIKKPGVVDQTLEIYPKEDTYPIIISTAGGPLLPDAGDPLRDIHINVTTSTEGDTGHIHIDYNDTTLKTTSLSIQVTQQNTTNTSAPEEVIASYTVANDANVTHTFDLLDYKGQSFFVRLEAEHPDFGTINRDYAVAFKGVRVPLGPLPDGLYIYVAGFGLMLLGGIFGATSATRGVVVIAFAGWLFYAFGWLDDLGLIAPASLGLVSTIAVMGVIVTRYREEGYT